MSLTNPIAKPPVVRVFGEFDHEEFDEAMAILRASAQLVDEHCGPAELTVVAQSRPGVVSSGQIELLRRTAPLSGAVALLGSWCEGETRTGRPWPGIPRLYWHEFPAWWRRQLALRAAGCCPDWARPANIGLRISDCGFRIRPPNSRGPIVISAQRRETREALADIFSARGYATVWQTPGRRGSVIHGAVAGVWEGGQLDECDANDLAVFCRSLVRDAAPVVAILDFPRRDRVAQAVALGAATVFGKPWLNADIVTTIEEIVTHRVSSDDFTFTRAA